MIFGGLFLFVLLGVIIAVALLGARWHRQHPGALRTRARSLWGNLGTRWSAHGYLAAHLALGLGVSVLALWGFVALADAVVEREAITQFDIALDNNLHEHATRLGIQIARLLSDVGSPIAMTALMIIVAVALWLRHERLLFITWLAAFVGGSVLDQTLKFLFHRPRPTFQTPIIVAHGFSFPSGHSMGSLIGFGMLAYLALRVTRRESLRTAIVIVAVALIVAIGLSRLYLGVHFFSDVVAGYAAGTVWLTMCLSGVELAAGERATRLTSAAPTRA